MVTTRLKHTLGRVTKRVACDASDLWVTLRVMRAQRLMCLTRSTSYPGMSVRSVAMKRVEIMIGV